MKKKIKIREIFCGLKDQTVYSKIAINLRYDFYFYFLRKKKEKSLCENYSEEKFNLPLVEKKKKNWKCECFKWFEEKKFLTGIKKNSVEKKITLHALQNVILFL